MEGSESAKIGGLEGRTAPVSQKGQRGHRAPPQYFNEDSQIAADDSEVKVDVDVGTPSRPPTSLPSRELNPDRGIVQNNAGEAATGQGGDSFVAPKVGRSDLAASQAAGIRSPYTYEPKGGDSLMEAASKLENDWDRIQKEASQQVASAANDTTNKLGAAVGSASEFGGLNPSRGELQPIAPNASAANGSSKGLGFQGLNGSAGLAPEPPKTAMATSPVNQPANAPVSNSTSSINYPKTAQADNRYQNLQNAVRESLTTENVAASASMNNSGTAAAPSAGGFQALDPVSRTAEYSVEGNTAAAVSEPQGRLAELPQELLTNSGGYSPGSTGRMHGKIY
jgi:hypothetical protein